MPDVQRILAATADGLADGPVPFALAGLMLLLLGAATWAAAVWWTAAAIHRPPRMVGGRAWARLGRTSPADLGLRFVDEPRDVPDAARPAESIRLAAWWLPHPRVSRRTCVLLHGYGDARAGALAWAALWQRLGFHLLLPDARAHGDSGGDQAGGGVLERDDLHRLLDDLKHRHPDACRDGIVLFAVSYAGLAATACAARRDDLSALVLESPVASWPDVTRRYARLLGLPLDHAHPLRMRLAMRRIGVDFAESDLVQNLAAITCPTLAILPQDDPLLDPAAADAIAATAQAWRPESGHNLAFAADPAGYERRLRAFLTRAGVDVPQKAAEAVS